MPTNDGDSRSFLLGAVGIRDDGAKVSAKNGATQYSTFIEDFRKNVHSHAEGRLLRKLGRNGIIYVARVAKLDGGLAMARPCGLCRHRIKSSGVKKVFYSIDNNHYGIYFVEADSDRIVECRKSNFHQMNIA